MLKLIEADERYLEEYKEAYLESLKEIEKGNISNHDLIFMNPDEYDVVKYYKTCKDQSKLPSYYVPAYGYFAVDGDKFIGVIEIRVRLTSNLLRYGGHIGYGINPKYWNMGYGKQLLKLALNEHKDLIEEDKILITCDDDNIPSAKIIEACGGILENKVENEDDGERFITRRYWIKK
ncbi:MAG: GNAT family N-acetyltransferase [Acholeplasmatales bacterium]|nr:GNAT family N-acetyltransferase [Acholeplasmatales bacterium]